LRSLTPLSGFILLTATCRSTTIDNVVFHGNNGHANVPRYYVIRTLPLLFVPQIECSCVLQYQICDTEILTALLMVQVFYDVTSCQLVNIVDVSEERSSSVFSVRQQKTSEELVTRYHIFRPLAV
jgi:hypothetical protein